MTTRQGESCSSPGERVQEIAAVWYKSIAQTAFVPVSLHELHNRLTQLAGDALALLHTDNFVEEEAQAIGAALANLHLVQAQSIGRSVELLTRELPFGLSPEQLLAVQPRMSVLLGAVTQGYFQKATELILAEQESVRQADVTTLRTLFNERQKQQQHLAQMHQKLQAQLAERVQIEQALRDSEEQFRVLFEESPVVLWVVDASQLFDHLSMLQKAGVQDLQSYFAHNPDALQESAKLLISVDVNQEAIRTTGLANKDALLNTPTAYWGQALKDLLWDWVAAFTSRKTTGTGTFSALTPTGVNFSVIYHWAVPLSSKSDYSRIILSFIDVTAQKDAEEKLQEAANRLAALHKIESGILRAESPQAIAEVALQHMGQIIPSIASAITLFQNSYANYVVLANRNTPFSPGYVLPADPAETTARKTNESLIVNDIAALPHKTIIMQMLEEIGARSLLSVPLFVQGKLIGTINLMDTKPGAFQENDVLISRQVGNSVAIAIHNSQLLEKEKRARREAETLRDVASIISGSMDQEELLNLILVQLERVLPHDRATILLKSGDKYDIFAHRGRELIVPESFLESDNIPSNFLTLIHEQRPLIIADTHDDPDWVFYPGSEFVRSWMGVPLMTKESSVGMLLLDKAETSFYTEEDAKLALAFANHAAVAIENANLYREVRQYVANLELIVAERTRELRALYEVTAATSTYQELEDVFDRINSIIIEQLNCAAISIQLLDESGTTLHLITHKNLDPQMREYLQTVPVKESPLGRIIESDEPIVYLSPPAAAELAEVPLPESSTYGIAAPMRIKGEVLGVFGVGYERGESPTLEDIALINSIADHVAAAIENDRLRKQAKQLAVLEERERLARDLHDSATQSLFSLTLLAAAAREHLQSGRIHLVNSQLEDLQETAIQTHREMRLLIYELRPKILEEIGIEKALMQRMQLVEFRTGIQGQITTNLNTELSIDVQQALFQVANEALNNALKHSNADTVSIDIRADDGQVAMKIKDNGSGFSADDTDFSAGLGLDIMRERIIELDGTFQFHSRLNEGTTITAQIPLQSTVEKTGD